jgi:hypothetical protein
VQRGPQLSKDPSLAGEWCKKERGYFVSSIDLSFEIGGAKEIFTLEWLTTGDALVDVGMYFLTYDEAKETWRRLESDGNKYSIRTVHVLSETKKIEKKG